MKNYLAVFSPFLSYQLLPVSWGGELPVNTAARVAGSLAEPTLGRAQGTPLFPEPNAGSALLLAKAPRLSEGKAEVVLP